MKKLITSIFYLFMVCMMISSCNSGENTPSGITVTNQDEFVKAFSAEGTSASINFNAEGDWSASVSTKDSNGENWIDINPKSGKAGENQTINITISENTGGEERSATITIISGDITVTITITQNGSKEGEGNVNPDKSLITKITAYGIKYDGGETVKLYESSLKYDNGKLISATSAGSYENYSKYTFNQECSYDASTKILKIQSEEKSEYPGGSSYEKRLENWNIETNELGYVTFLSGKVYINDKLRSSATDEYDYDNEGYLRYYHFVQKGYDEFGNETGTDGYSNSTYIWNNGNLTELHDNDLGLSWLKMEYGEELNDAIFDLNQLMCYGSTPMPDYTPILLNMGKISKNLQTKYYYYYEGETPEGEDKTSRTTVSGYEAIEISYERDDKGRVAIIRYKHPDKFSKPDYSETMLKLSYTE